MTGIRACQHLNKIILHTCACCSEMGKSALMSYFPLNIGVKFSLLFLLIFIFCILGLNFIHFFGGRIKHSFSSIVFFFFYK